MVTGPDQAYRGISCTQVWARKADADSTEVSAPFTGPEGYEFTVLAVLGAVKSFLKEPLRPDALTPSMALNPDFIDDAVNEKDDAFRLLAGTSLRHFVSDRFFNGFRRNPEILDKFVHGIASLMPTCYHPGFDASFHQERPTKTPLRIDRYQFR